MKMDFASLLLLPTLVTHEKTVSTDPNKASCRDVSTETCWLLAFLTDTDFKEIDITSGSHVVTAITTTLSLATDSASQLYEAKTLLDIETKQQLSEDCLCLIPLCRILRNIALERGHARSMLINDIFLTPKQVTLAHPTETCLTKLISLGTLGAGQDSSILASKATEAAAGYLSISYPSTSYKLLLSALCKTLASPLAIFDVKREVACTLWDVVCDFREQRKEIDEFQSVQRQLLMEIINTSPPEILSSLTSLLATMDVNATEAAIHLIDLFLREIDNVSGKKISVLLEEVGLVELLWRVCDNDSDECAIAELAASILDDFYEENDVDEDDEIAPSSDGSCFQFQAPSINPVGGFDFTSSNPSTTLSEPKEQRLQMGRGRGRGQQIPAWMEKSQQT
jgi:hypothetical protein